MEIIKVIKYKGRKYWLSGTNPKYYYNDRYFGTGKKGRKKVALHRQIWEDSNKRKIPKGYVVHHIDENTFNNSPENLAIKERRQHQSEHVKEWLKNPEYLKKIKSGLLKAQEEAKKWHASKEGHEWHKKHWLKSIAIAKKHKHKCYVCGSEFESTRVKCVKYCSQKCRNIRKPLKKPLWKPLCDRNKDNK